MSNPLLRGERPSPRCIELRGVRVHNLQNIDVDIPLGRLVGICGRSGAGKSSLAFDTLYAEGQRRYVESFPAYERKYLERLDPPEADRIAHVPPAVAVRARREAGLRRATVGTATEVYDLLRLLMTRAGVLHCPACGLEIHTFSPADATAALRQIAEPVRVQIAVSVSPPSEESFPQWQEFWQQRGFVRTIWRTVTRSLADLSPADFSPVAREERLLFIVDRLRSADPEERLTDSLESAYQHGEDSAVVLFEKAVTPLPSGVRLGEPLEAGGHLWHPWICSSRLICPGCHQEFPEMEPRLFSFSSPQGACPHCRGAGEIVVTRGGMATVCPICHGARLQPVSLSVRLGGRNIAELCQLRSPELGDFLQALPHPESRSAGEAVATLVPRLLARLGSLGDVGLNYLALHRSLATLSSGEARRIALAAALGSQLVNTVFVLDEPSAGLHVGQRGALLRVLQRLRDVGNTVVMIEHDPELLSAADWLIELGPGSGKEGGQLVFSGKPALLEQVETSATRRWLRRMTGDDAAIAKHSPRQPTGKLRLTGVRHHNLEEVSVEFPLGVLCVVAGVGGSGKTSLACQTLFPALCTAIGRPAQGAKVAQPGTYAALTGGESLQDVVLVEGQLVARSARSIPATVMGVWPQIRRLFAETAEAKVLNFTERHFSFNHPAGGRCPTCAGLGTLAVDLQFLPDVSMTCPDCQGRRYLPEILQVRCRGLNLAEVLDLSIREAFTFFRGLGQIQRRLQWVKDLGLDYLLLGQSPLTFSGGELQRLTLAAAWAGRSRLRTLFILDEPTFGLHPDDVVKLCATWGHLLAAGHSLLVVEHHPQVLAAADWIIELGPGEGPAGGKVVAAGTPGELLENPSSSTRAALHRPEARPSAQGML